MKLIYRFNKHILDVMNIYVLVAKLKPLKWALRQHCTLAALRNDRVAILEARCSRIWTL